MTKISAVIMLALMLALAIGGVWLQVRNEKKFAALKTEFRAELKAGVDGVISDSLKLREQMAALEKQNAQLQADIESVRTELGQIGNLSFEQAGLKQKDTEFSRAIEESKGKLGAVEVTATNADSQIAAYRRELADYQSRLTALEESNTQLQTALEKQKKELSRMKEMNSFILKNSPADEIIQYFCTIPDETYQTEITTLGADFLRDKLKASSFRLCLTDDMIEGAKALDIMATLRKMAADFDPHGNRIIYLSNQTVTAYPDGYSRRRFHNVARGWQRVYAYWQPQPVWRNQPAVIAKWVNLTDKKLERLHAYQLDPVTQFNNVYYERNWMPGDYMVAFYKQISDDEPIAYGLFKIEPPQ